MLARTLGPVCTLVFVLATFGLGLALILITTEVTIDISGYGTCDGNVIRATNMSTWTQYPAPPVVGADPSLAVVQGFVGHNSIVWGEGAELIVFKVTGARGDGDHIDITTDRDLHVQGTCHFTLDPNGLGYV